MNKYAEYEREKEKLRKQNAIPRRIPAGSSRYCKAFGNMNATEAAAIIKNAVSMRECAERYGFRLNRAGFMCCPFHAENAPSLKCYEGNRGFSCLWVRRTWQRHRLRAKTLWAYLLAGGYAHQCRLRAEHSTDAQDDSESSVKPPREPRRGKKPNRNGTPKQRYWNQTTTTHLTT